METDKAGPTRHDLHGVRWLRGVLAGVYAPRTAFFHYAHSEPCGVRENHLFTEVAHPRPQLFLLGSRGLQTDASDEITGEPSTQEPEKKTTHGGFPSLGVSGWMKDQRMTQVEKQP